MKVSSPPEILEAETQTVKPIIRRKSVKEFRKAVVDFLAELGGAVRAIPIDHEGYGRCDCGRCFGRCFGRTPQGRYGSYVMSLRRLLLARLVGQY